MNRTAVERWLRVSETHAIQEWHRVHRLPMDGWHERQRFGVFVDLAISRYLDVMCPRSEKHGCRLAGQEFGVAPETIRKRFARARRERRRPHPKKGDNVSHKLPETSGKLEVEDNVHIPEVDDDQSGTAEQLAHSRDSGT